MFFIRYVTLIGNVFPQFLICCFLLFVDFRMGYQVGSLWFWAYLVNLILKNTIRKRRPPKQDWLITKVSGFSFPSGHSLTSLVLFWSIVKYFEIAAPFSYFLYALPVILGASRFYLKVHYPEDIVGGWAIAIFFLHFFESKVLDFQFNFYGFFYDICHVLL